MPIPLMAIASGAGLLGKLFGGAGQGSASERTNANQFTLNKNQQDLSKYTTQQSSLLQALLAQSNQDTSRYNTQQGATTNAMQGMQGAVSNAMHAQSAENLNRAQLGLQAPSVRAQQSVMGSLMKNLQPMQMEVAPGQRGHTPTIRGGMSAAMLDPMTRQHGDELMKSALMAQLSGSDVPEKSNFLSGVQNWGSSVLAPPGATDFQSGIIAPPALGGYKDAGKGESLLSGLGMGGGILSEILKLIAGAQGSRDAEPSDENGFG